MVSSFVQARVLYLAVAVLMGSTAWPEDGLWRTHCCFHRGSRHDAGATGSIDLCLWVFEHMINISARETKCSIEEKGKNQLKWKDGKMVQSGGWVGHLSWKEKGTKRATVKPSEKERFGKHKDISLWDKFLIWNYYDELAVVGTNSFNQIQCYVEYGTEELLMHSTIITEALWFSFVLWW